MAQLLAKTDPRYESIVTEAVDSGLSLLGESGKQAIYYYLEKDYNIKKDNMPSNIQNFSKALDKTFGIGSVYIKVQIVIKFYQKIGAPIPENVDASVFFEEIDPKKEKSNTA